MTKRDCVSVLDIEAELKKILDDAINLKAGWARGEREKPLAGKSMAMIFEKPSTRTRVSFEVGMAQLGGYALNLARADIQLGRGETITDTARVLSRYVDIIMYRAFDHNMVSDLAKNATIPVINGLDNLEHPCQTLADLMTILEHKKGFEGKKLAYIGDGNNVCNSLLLGAAVVGMDMSAICPEEYKPDEKIYKKALEIASTNNCKIDLTSVPEKGVENADIIYTDTWISMGDDADAEARNKAFQPYQVNTELVSAAKDDYIFMHCLPAHRNSEVTDEVMDGENSVIFDQAENRLHAQKALILFLLEAK
ncbi:MAG: ornithine carbamoyltransferase [Thermoplasmata archaeon]|nr:MAG: ornithine carbamoyltransferase [Thermoplasmata archaeon]